jgi:hypothetical protein
MGGKNDLVCWRCRIEYIDDDTLENNNTYAMTLDVVCSAEKATGAIAEVSES